MYYFYQLQDTVLYQFTLIVLGSVLCFLLFNKNPARIFMGIQDLLLWVLVLQRCQLLPKPLALIITLGAVYIMETLSVIIQVLVYKKTKKDFF